MTVCCDSCYGRITVYHVCGNLYRALQYQQNGKHRPLHFYVHVKRGKVLSPVCSSAVCKTGSRGLLFARLVLISQWISMQVRKSFLNLGFLFSHIRFQKSQTCSKFYQKDFQNFNKNPQKPASLAVDPWIKIVKACDLV